LRPSACDLRLIKKRPGYWKRCFAGWSKNDARGG
jgi:hypothetical protein